MRKKRVLLHSNYCGVKTGFGGFVRELMTYLYKTGKYDLTLFAAGIAWNHEDYARWPWRVIGALPNDPKELEMLNRDPNLARGASYGAYLIDNCIKEVKPDIYIGVEDPWGLEYCKDRVWWNKISCVVHSTIDSRPLLASAVELAKRTDHFYCWADFATKDFHKMGLNHVKTLRGTVNTNVYRRLPSEERKRIRASQNIPEDAFCVGMLSRNQLRKSFPVLIEGYQQFRKANPEIKEARLLLFTHFSEGWNIMDRIKEYGVNPKEVLACYKCRATGEYFLLPFTGQDIDNPKTGHQKSLITVNIQDGLTDEQVNEWFNILDVYAHPFTSGGQERSIQEAKLAELVTLVTNYSCGEDSCVPEAASLPLDYAEYRENGTEFIKAATYPSSVAKQIKRVYEMAPQKKREMGRTARKWVLDNFSIELIGKKFEELLDSLPETTYDFSFKQEEKHPNAVIEPSSDDKVWVKSLYKEILNMDVVDNDEGLKYWLVQLTNHAPRQSVEDYFRKVAIDENNKTNKNGIDLEEILGDEPPTDRVLINIPESLGDCLYVTSLLRDARVQYKDKKIYVATKPQYKEVFAPLVGDLIDYVIDWNPSLDDSMKLEGYGSNVGYFRVVLQPHFPTQRMINYLHHGEGKSAINLKYRESRAISNCDELYEPTSPAR